MLVINAVMTKQRREIGTEGNRGSQVGNFDCKFQFSAQRRIIEKATLKRPVGDV